jgi:hypothetical protein
MSERFKFSYIVYGNIVQHEQNKYNDNLHCVVLTRLAVGVRVDGEDVAQLELEIELVPPPSSVEVFRRSVGKNSSLLL